MFIFGPMVDYPGMAANPHITRLILVPHTGSNDELRRYRLARMDEVALASPANAPRFERREAPASAPREALRPAGERAPTASR